MRKVIILILFIVLLSGCADKKIHVYNDEDINKFDDILTNIGNGRTRAYDLRIESECIEERIPGFFCMRTVNSNGEVISLNRIFENLIKLIGKDYRYLIILIDNDGSDSSYLAEKLFDAGYYNVHYFSEGYERYKELKGEDFIPETGDCNIC